MITFLRGISGSGKSTWAKEVAEGHPNTVIVSRDKIREELVGVGNLSQYFKGGMDKSMEDHITRIEHRRLQNAAFDDMHIYNYGARIIIDNLNIKNAYIDQYMHLLANLDYNPSHLRLEDFDVPVDECARRCQLRDDYFPISKEIIQQQYERLHSAKESGLLWSFKDYCNCGNLDHWDQGNARWDDWIQQNLPAFYRPEFAVEPYYPNYSLPKALICDLDGTLAHRSVICDIDEEKHWYMRKWYNDEDDVATDTFDEAVLCTIQALCDKDYQILFVSGRKETARNATEAWLNSRLARPYRLFMRDPSRDMHDGKHDKDDVVKYRIFNEEIRNTYNVQMVFDDRKRVVALWETLGIKVFNVGGLNDDF